MTTTKTAISLFARWGNQERPRQHVGVEEVEFDSERELQAFLTGVRMTLGFDLFAFGDDLEALRRRVLADPAADDTDRL